MAELSESEFGAGEVAADTGEAVELEGGVIARHCKHLLGVHGFVLRAMKHVSN